MEFSPSLEQRLRSAIQAFWTTRESQANKQGSRSGIRDAGFRTAVTGGAQMNGFISVIRDLLEESGHREASHIYCERSVELPGWFRPEKKWDLLVVVDACLIAAIEFKSQVDRSETITTTEPKRLWEAQLTSGLHIAKERLSRRHALGSGYLMLAGRRRLIR